MGPTLHVVSLDSQIAVMEGVYEEGRRLYEGSKRAVAQLLPEVEITRRKVTDYEQQLDALKERATEALDSLNQVSTQRQRLVRQEATAAETFEKFAKLSEEGRIARQIAATNLRVITRAVTAGAGGSWQRQKVWVSGVVGLMVSVFLAFLLEYVAKARGLREESDRTGAPAS